MTLFSKRNVVIGALVALAAGASAYFVTRPAEASVAIGQAAPAFSAVDSNGQTRTLAEFAGRTIVLEWTNDGCPYVRKHYNSGNMQATQRAATAQGAVWLSVISSAPGEQGYADGARANALGQSSNAAPSAILLDPGGVMGHAYGARTTPHMFIINGQGEIVYQGAIDNRPTAQASSLQGATNHVLAALGDMAAGRAVAVAETVPYGCSVKYRG